MVYLPAPHGPSLRAWPRGAGRRGGFLGGGSQQGYPQDAPFPVPAQAVFLAYTRRLAGSSRWTQRSSFSFFFSALPAASLLSSYCCFFPSVRPCPPPGRACPGMGSAVGLTVLWDESSIQGSVAPLDHVRRTSRRPRSAAKQRRGRRAAPAPACALRPPERPGRSFHARPRFSRFFALDRPEAYGAELGGTCHRIRSRPDSPFYASSLRSSSKSNWAALLDRQERDLRRLQRDTARCEPHGD